MRPIKPGYSQQTLGSKRVWFRGGTMIFRHRTGFYSWLGILTPDTLFTADNDWLATFETSSLLYGISDCRNEGVVCSMWYSWPLPRSHCLSVFNFSNWDRFHFSHYPPSRLSHIGVHLLNNKFFMIIANDLVGWSISLFVFEISF